MEKKSALGAIHSDYIGTAETMAQFLTCWSNEIKATPIPDERAASPVDRSFDARLPRSARDFFEARAKTGFVSLYERLYPQRQRFADPQVLKSFREVSPKDFDNWTAAFGTLTIPDERYYVYNKAQQTGFRGSDLNTMLVLGQEWGGAFYLMLPSERTQDGEAEVMFLHHGGLIVRFKSFAHLVANLYLEEREKTAGRDASLGHLYHFPGKLADTCVASIISVT